MIQVPRFAGNLDDGNVTWTYNHIYVIMTILNEEGYCKSMDEYTAFGDAEWDEIIDREEITEELESLLDIEADHFRKTQA